MFIYFLIEKSLNPFERCQIIKNVIKCQDFITLQNISAYNFILKKCIFYDFYDDFNKKNTFF